MSPLSQTSPSGMDIKEYLEQKREAVDGYLLSIIPAADTPPTTLHESMRYSLFAGGKRVRPILVIAAAEASVGLAIIIAIYRSRRSVIVEDVNLLKG